MPQLRLALAQLNAVVGDIDGNVARVLDYAHQAHDRGAHVAVFPEMMVTGYPVEDLALRANFVDASREAVQGLAKTLASEGLGDMVVVVGYLDKIDGAIDRLGVPKGSPLNAAAVITGGEIVTRYFKHHLPNYGVFDEFRWFVPGDTMHVIQVHGIDIGIAICEDLWQDGPSDAAAAAETALLLVLNGSPYDRDKDDVRFDLCKRRAQEGVCTLAYVNLVGGQDDLVFDGDSIIVDVNGDIIDRADQFTEELMVVDLDLPGATAAMPDPAARFSGLKVERTIISTEALPAYEPLAVPGGRIRHDDLGETYKAIVLGLRDYVQKNGFSSVLMGVSGGIDSTLVAAIACDAIGAENVYGVSNPSKWSSDHSKSDAAELARRTGMHFDTVAIAPIVETFLDSVAIDGLAEENLQARIRAVIWMALSNQHGHLVLACGNKSELAVGYSTIYGDAVGGYAPIKDVPKTLVWQLAQWRNDDAISRGEEPPIPEDTITKPPSAELRPGQLDTDSLPPYELLDAIIDEYVAKDRGSREIIADGKFDKELVERVIALIDRAEYKRRQYPPGPKVSGRNFGRDWRVPITNRWREKL
ncbi:MAG: synthase [Nocardioidaceae bacterium]|nr:synthase [Nocardioidaceae bacterium]